MPTFNEIITYLHEILVSIGDLLPCTQLDIFCGVIISIIVLFITSFSLLLTTRRDFRREHNELKKLKNNLNSKEKNIVAADTSHFYEILSGLRQNTLVYERVKIVHQILGQEKLTLSLTEISDLTISKKEAEFKHQFVNFVIAVLLIIGLAGTFWAFRDILSGLNPDLSQFEENLSKIHSGFRHAFLASLAGIIGTIILLFIKHVMVNPLRESFFYQLDWITQTRLIPLFSQPNQTDQVANILLATATKFETAVVHIQSLSQDMRDNIAHTKGFAFELNQLSEKVRDITELFEYTTGEESPFYKASSNLYDAVNQSRQHYEELGKGLGDLINQNRELVNQNRAHNEQLKLLRTDFEKIHQHSSKHLEQISTNLNKLMQQYLIKTGTITKELQELVIGLKNQQVEYTIDIGELSGKIKESALIVADATQQFNVFLEQVNKQANETIPQLSQIGFSGFMRKMAEYQQQLENQLDQNRQIFASRIEEQTKEVLLQLNQIDSLRKIEQNMLELPSKAEIQEIVEVLQDIRQESLKKISFWERFKRK